MAKDIFNHSGSPSGYSTKTFFQTRYTKIQKFCETTFEVCDNAFTLKNELHKLFKQIFKDFFYRAYCEPDYIKFENIWLKDTEWMDILRVFDKFYAQFKDEFSMRTIVKEEFNKNLIKEEFIDNGQKRYKYLGFCTYDFIKAIKKYEIVVYKVFDFEDKCDRYFYINALDVDKLNNKAQNVSNDLMKNKLLITKKGEEFYINDYKYLLKEIQPISDFLQDNQ